MKEHKWLMTLLEFVVDPDGDGNRIFIRSRLVNTDGRRKIKYFSIIFEPNKYTLSSFSDLFREGQKLVDIQEGKRPKKKKNAYPKPDKRQMEMFGGYGGDHERPIETIME